MTRKDSLEAAKTEWKKLVKNYEDITKEESYVLWTEPYKEFYNKTQYKIVSCFFFTSTILFLFEFHNFFIVIRRRNALDAIPNMLHRIKIYQKFTSTVPNP